MPLSFYGKFAGHRANDQIGSVNLQIAKDRLRTAPPNLRASIAVGLIGCVGATNTPLEVEMGSKQAAMDLRKEAGLVKV